ncbi:XDD3 family exosortase-dependent surface protein [Lusitaniella coriacea]|uniref:XDD3 family exosortase-dependent surface protein n=1 Tax=Lusitaniella coriacea TaxID=1983105 RepID=UPI003CF49E20
MNNRIVRVCTGIFVCAIALATVEPVVAGTFRNGWQYAVDPSYDSYGSVNGGIQVGGTIYEIYGMAIKEDPITNRITVALNSNLPLTGNPTGSEVCNGTTCFPVENNSVAWGDIFFDVSGTGNFQEAFDNGQIVGVRFSPNNDSRTPDGSRLETGVYTGITGANVAGQNAGFRNLYHNRQLVKDRGDLGNREPWMGDIAWNNPYYGSYGSSSGSWATSENLMPNIIANGEKRGDVTIESEAALVAQGFDPSWFFQTGSQILGFSFEKIPELVGDFIATLLQECINDGISLIGSLSEPSSTPVLPEPDLCDIPMRNEQAYIIQPTRIQGDLKIFENTFSHLWYDPDPEMGYTFRGQQDTLFTEILNFPCGLDADDKFTVSVGNLPLGEFQPGQSVNFSQLIPGITGVPEFTITGINPENDYTPFPSESQFASQLKFNVETPSFTIETFYVSVPEPNSVLSLILLGGAGVSVRFLRKKSKR